MKTERISMATCYSIDEKFDSDKFIKLRLKLCHDGENPAGSTFTAESLKDASDSIKNIPILAYVVANDKKGLDFDQHNMAFEKNALSDNDDDFKLVYQETPIGMIPEDCNYELAEEDGRTYAFADGYIWKDYANYAQDIIERDGTKNLSMEAILDEVDINTIDKKYTVTKFRYKGVTLLGDDVRTGMANAKATVETFTADIYERMTQIMTELKFALEAQKKEVNKKMEDATKVIDTPTPNEGGTATFADNTSNTEPVPAANEPDTGVVDTGDTGSTDGTENFALSHDAIRDKIRKTLRSTGVDGWIGDVYDTMFEYHAYGAEENIMFRQNYSIVDDEIVFDGQAEKLYIEKVTEAEKAELEAARAGKETELEELRMSVEALKTENLALAKFKQDTEAAQAAAAREAVIAKWTPVLADNADFSALTSGDMSQFSAEDLEVKCKIIFADANAKFSAEPKKPESNIVRFALGNNNDEKVANEPYGGLFTEFGANKE